MSWWTKRELIKQVGEVGKEVVIQHFLGDDEDDPCLKVSKTWTTPDSARVFLKNQPTITYEYCIEHPEAPAVLVVFATQVAEMLGAHPCSLLLAVISGLGLGLEEAQDALSEAHQRCEEEL